MNFLATPIHYTMPSEPEVCSTSTVEWAGLIITIIGVNVSWWLFSIPIWFQYGYRQYTKSVMWECFRVYMPSLAALAAIALAQTPEEEPYIYYVGPFYDLFHAQLGQDLDLGPDVPRHMSKFQYAKALVADGLTIASTTITIYTAVNLPTTANVVGIHASVWVYPTLPVAVIGLWLLLCPLLNLKSRWWTVGLGLSLVLAVGLAIGLLLALGSEVSQTNKIWIGGIVTYAVMALPLTAYDFCGNWWVFLCTTVCWYCRVGQLGIAVIRSTFAPEEFPFCPLQKWGFGFAYLIVGLIGLYFAFFGRLKFFLTISAVAPLNPRNTPGPGVEMEAVPKIGIYKPEALSGYASQQTEAVAISSQSRTSSKQPQPPHPVHFGLANPNRASQSPPHRFYSAASQTPDRITPVGVSEMTIDHAKKAASAEMFVLSAPRR